MKGGGSIVRAGVAALLLPGMWFTAGAAHASTPHVLLVGTYNGVTGQYTTIQAAVDAAQNGDWILVGPGDYHERQDYTNNAKPAAVWIGTPNVHLRGMDRNGVIVDGTKPTAVGACSSAQAAQDLGPGGQGRNGIEVGGQAGGADGVSIDNLTACNFMDGSHGNGNQIWWNGGDGHGIINLHGYTGTYLTASSTYSNGVNNPSGSYGIFSSDATGYADGTKSLWQNDYASNMSDSAYYIGACQQRCDVIMNQDRGQYSALCLSSTNAGGYLLVENTECDQNKTGLVNNSQNNDDWPSPQNGQCDLGVAGEPQVGATGTTSCTVWMNNHLHDNNNPNVPGNGIGGLAGGGPVGTGLILAGSRDVTVTGNLIENNKSWGELFVDLPDQESGPAHCQGGIDFNPPNPPIPGGEVCFYPDLGNVSLNNTFKTNGGGYGATPPNPTLGDIGLATIAHTSPPFDNALGNCFHGDTDPTLAGNPSTDPPGLETLPQYQPSNGLCTQSNAGDYGPLTATAECDSQLLAPCPTLQTLCNYEPVVPCVPVLTTPADFPRPDATFVLTLPSADKTPTMPNPCLGVPANAFCDALAIATPDFPIAVAGPLAGGGVVLAAMGVTALRRRARAKRGARG